MSKKSSQFTTSAESSDGNVDDLNQDFFAPLGRIRLTFKIFLVFLWEHFRLPSCLQSGLICQTLWRPGSWSQGTVKFWVRQHLWIVPLHENRHLPCPFLAHFTSSSASQMYWHPWITKEENCESFGWNIYHFRSWILSQLRNEEEFFIPVCPC